MKKCCVGCDTEFESENARRLRCKPGCGRNRSTTSGASRKTGSDKNRELERRKTLRAIKASLPTEFVGVDGEGFDRIVSRLLPVSELTSAEMDAIDNEMQVYDGSIADLYDYDDDGQLCVEVTERVHQYEMLGIGNEQIGKKGKALHFTEVFEFLYDHYTRNPDSAYVGFFLGYDFTHWLRTIEAWEAKRLLTKEGIRRRTPKPESPRKLPYAVGFKCQTSFSAPVIGWEVDMLGSKRMQLRPLVHTDDWPKRMVKNPETGEMEERKYHPFSWQYICDAGSFFATSLMKAIDPKASTNPVVTAEEYAILKAGKDSRDSADFDKETSEYNRLENEVLSRLMSQLDEGLRSIGVHLNKRQWMGPGQAAQEWMKSIGVITAEAVREEIPIWGEYAAKCSYYGGRFEIMAHGIVRGISYNYDINSAYPYVIKTLPCLMHGEWKKGEGRPPRRTSKTAFRLFRVTTHKWPKASTERPYLGGLPHREGDGSIKFPLSTSGWYYESEILAAKRAGLIHRFSVHEWISYEGCGCRIPLSEIETLYLKRLEVGKNTPQGKAMKIVFNSAYGKMAQSIGQPRFANAVYASLITSGCRVMILDSIATHPVGSSDVLMIATDGIVFRTPHETLDINPTRLGAWDGERYENLTLLLPGLYWTEETRRRVAERQADLKLKSRGVSDKVLGAALEAFDAMFVKMLEDSRDKLFNRWGIVEVWPEYSVTVPFAFKSAKLAAHQNRWSEAGMKVENERRDMSSCPYTKRETAWYDPRVGYVRSYPYETGRGSESLPYKPLFGMDADSVMQFEDDLLLRADEGFMAGLLEAFGKV